MPMYESPMPVSATNPKIVHNGETYNLVLGTDTFVRVGEDGNVVILPLFGGDEFVGEVLEGFWKKGWDAGMDADQVFTAILDGAGTLELEGEADVAGVAGNGWINGHLPLPLINDLEVTLSMSVPVDDTGGVASRDIGFDFYLRGDKKAVDIPSGDADFIRLKFDVDETGLILIVSKEVATVNTVLDSGYDYTMDGTRSTGDLEAVVWRIVFHDGVAGAAAPENVRHMHIYMKQSDTIGNAEAATENQLDDSPYDISDLLFNVAYPALQIISQNTTYYDAGNEAKVGRITVNEFPNNTLRYDFVDADYGKGDVELWDGDPAVATSQRVFDEDHEFSNDIYLQNGLIRLRIQEGTVYGTTLYYYDGAAWSQVANRVFMLTVTDITNIRYPRIRSIETVNTERTTIKVRSHDDATDDSDEFVDLKFTIERGKLYYTTEFEQISPEQDLIVYFYNSVKARFGYLLDVDAEGIADDDLGLSTNNQTPDDNHLIWLDDLYFENVVGVMASNIEPVGSGGRYNCTDGGVLEYNGIDTLDITTTQIYRGITPFALIANLFEEAEDATLGGGATTPGNDPAASGAGNNYVLLNAQNETVDYVVVAGTDLPAGRYLAVFRALDSNQVALDFEMSVQNTSDGEYRNEEGADVHTVLTAAYAFYSLVFDITAEDVTGTDNIRIRAKKDTAGANSIRVDDFLIIPIGDGESFPQDLAHAALRAKDQPRRLYER